jgi:mRNA-degrading endonuclease RelE of RelBE toxin-antitoxin system
MNTQRTSWTVRLNSKSRKRKEKLPPDIAANLLALLTQLELTGPVQPKWPHYGKLRGQKKETHHCHLNRGRPIYVAVWQIEDTHIKLMEITYVGTHENAPY